MRTISIIICLALFAIIGVTLLYMTDKLDECKSVLGSFAQILSSDIQQKCAKAGQFFLILAFAWIFLGFLSAILIGMAIFRWSIIAGVCYSFFVIILILRLSSVI